MGHVRLDEDMMIGALMAMMILGSEKSESAKALVDEHLKIVRPLEYKANLAWWNANTTGSDAEFKRKEEAQNALDAALSNKERFEALKKFDKDGEISDPVLKRQIHLLYLQYLEKQVDAELLKKMTAKANAIEKAFNAYRAKLAGVEITDGKVREILKKSVDSKELQNVWESSKGVGAVVEKDLKELVGLRNQAAKTLGFDNFHSMMLILNEQDPKAVLKLFDDLDAMTRQPFLAAKAEIDEKLAKRFNCSVADLRPWHYQDPFFQESPAVFAADLDAPYKSADILKMCSNFYKGIGLPIDDVIARSDLYEKPGKSPHAFCTDIDREGDVRVLGNIVPTEYWAGTMLHELGHSVYSSKNIPSSLPYVLRTESHILTTEGVAMMFERFSKNGSFLEKMGISVSDRQAFDDAARRMRRNRLLIFSRWCQVMLRFEKELYGNPDQDLNALWWSLVEKYQGLKKPDDRNAPDYASKVHIVTAPCYYHNYEMGELFACQVHYTMVNALQPGVHPRDAVYVNDPRVGEFMKEKVFSQGKLLPWNDLTKHATGKELNPEAFAEDLK
jgi:peptidyl-dipeptidase A